MLRRANDLQGYSIAATDGELGKVQDFYFDDQEWTVRYFVVDTGGWLSGRLVLVAPDVVLKPDDAKESLPVSLTKQQVKDSPGIEAHLPFSMQQEIAYRNHFGWPPYWGGVAGVAAFDVTPPIAVSMPTEQANPPGGDELNTHLRSVNVVRGYHIAARDGEIGHVDDFVIDDEKWGIRYLIVDTRNWLPGKKVLLAPAWVESVEWPESDVVVRLTREQIQSAPEYDDETPITREYEARLHEHYGQPTYWS